MDIFDDFALSAGTEGALGINLAPAPSSLSTDPTLQVFTGSLIDSQYDFFPFSLSVVAVVEDTVYGDDNEIISLLADNQGIAFRVFQTNHMSLLTAVIRSPSMSCTYHRSACLLFFSLSPFLQF